jgi:hypothetical protein
MADMASGCRHVSLSQLAQWRRSGLLPPFSSRGRGQGKGKTYYWTQANILPHARTVYDLLQRHGRADMVLVTLWLCGFDVPLPRLRRAWMSTRGTADAGHAKWDSPALSHSHADDGLSGLLLNAMFSLADATGTGAAADDAAAVRLIAQALVKVDMTDLESHWNADAAGLWRLLRMLAADAHVDALVVAADEDEMRRARRYLLLAARLLQDGTTTPLWIAEHMARPLFSLAVAMLCSGRGDLLARLASRADGMDRQSIARPVHVLHS